ncbi:hypothetical protein Tco_0385144, partial [Tanacetum coccineum]
YNCHIPASTPTPIPETDPEPLEPTFEEPSPAHQHFSPPQEHAQGQMPMDDLLKVVPQLMTKIDSLEKDLKQTKLTMGSAIVKLVKKVKKLEGVLKRRNLVLSDSKEEEPKAQGRKSQDDPLVSLVQGMVTPSKTTVNALGEEQSIDKGRRYKRSKETTGKKVVTSLDFQEEVSTGYAEGVNTGSIKVSIVSEQVSTVSGQVSTDSIKMSIPSPNKGQREGKSPMIIEEAPKKTKEQLLQEEASLAEAIKQRLQKDYLKNTVKKERKARPTYSPMAIPKEHLRRFHGMDDAKEIWEAIRTRFGGNANSKKMQKAILKQQFKRDSFYQNQGARKKEQNQNCLLTMDDGVVNWGEHTLEEEETNHALMAISSSNEISLCSKTCIDSYNTLKTLCDEQMNQLGDQEAQILPINSQALRTRSSTYDRSSKYSTCQSNDSEGSIGTSSEHSVDPESEISSVPPEVKANYGNGYSFTNKEMFLYCGSLSHLIKDCDYMKRNGKRSEVKKQRVVKFWTNINTVRPNINTGRTNINPVRPRVNTGSSNVNTVRSRQPGSAVKTSAGYNWRNTNPNSNCDSGPTFIRTVNAKDASWITMLPNTEIFEGMGQMGSKSGGWDQFGSNIATALICLSTGRVYNFSKLIFDGMVANLKSKTKFLMYPRFLQLILDIQTENKHHYLAVTLTNFFFGNMKRGFRGALRPLLPAMLLVASTNLNAGQAHTDVAPSQPSSSTIPVPSTSLPPVQPPPPTATPIPASTPTPNP